MTVELSGFVGAILIGRVTPERSLFVDDVLGSCFVVDPHKRIVLTCEHVLPEKELKKEGIEIAFHGIDAEGNQLTVKIDPTFWRQCEDRDVVALRLLGSGVLRTYPIETGELHMGSQLLAMGTPKDPIRSRPGDVVVIRRGINSFLVSGYDDEFEVDRPFIHTMSGCPVMYQGRIAGIATDNRVYTLERVAEESEMTERDGTKHKKTYFHDERTRFGVAYYAKHLSTWIDGVVAAA